MPLTARPRGARALPVAPGVAGAVLAALGLWLVLHRLGVGGASSDEIVYVRAAQAYLQGDFSLNQEHPPLAKWVIASGLTGGLVGQELLAAARLPVALLGWLTGFVCAATAGVLTRRWAAAVVAGGLWWLLPTTTGPAYDLVRVAMLEGPMLLGIALSLLLWAVAWRTRRLRWWPAAAAVAGLAAAAKLPGLVALVGLGPVLLAALLRRGTGPRRRARLWLLALGSVVLAALAFLVTYLPAGDQAAGWLRHTFGFQLDHVADGHVIEVAGELTTSAPWWTAWWWQSRYLSWVGVAALWGLAVLGLARWRRSGSWVVAAPLLAGTVVLALSSAQLPHYHLMLVPMLVVAAGCAVVGPGPGARSRVVPALAVVGLLLLVPTAGRHVVDIARMSPGAFATAAQVLDERGVEPTLLTVWADPFATGWYLPEWPRTVSPPEPDGVLLVNEGYARRRGFEFEQWCAAECAGRERVDLGSLDLYLPGPGIP